MAIYEITPDKIIAIPGTTFAEAGLLERMDLQRLLREQIEILSPDTLVIAEEFADWQDSKRRIDLLGIDRDAKLVVIELKRTEDGGHMELQALRYAAMVSTMTFERAAAALARLRNLDGDEARAQVLDFLGWDEPDPDSFAQDVRIVLASAEFSRELTTAVIWPFRTTTRCASATTSASSRLFAPCWRRGRRASNGAMRSSITRSARSSRRQSFRTRW